MLRAVIELSDASPCNINASGNIVYNSIGTTVWSWLPGYGSLGMLLRGLDCGNGKGEYTSSTDIFVCPGKNMSAQDNISRITPEYIRTGMESPGLTAPAASYTINLNLNVPVSGGGMGGIIGRIPPTKLWIADANHTWQGTGCVTNHAKGSELLPQGLNVGAVDGSGFWVSNRTSDSPSTAAVILNGKIIHNTANASEYYNYANKLGNLRSNCLLWTFTSNTLK